MSLVPKYLKFLDKYKIVIIVFWVIVLGFSIWLGPRFLDETTSTFEAPEDSPSATAETVLAEDFPDIDNGTSIVFIIRSNNENVSIINSESRLVHDDLIDTLYSSDYNDSIFSILSYYTLTNLNYSEFASSFISTQERSMLIIAEINYEPTKDENDID